MADVPIAAGTRVLRLGDIAEVTRGYADPPTFLLRHNRQPAVGLAVAMAENTNVLELGKNLKAAVAGASANPWDAVVESTVRRARPVVLTALAAILAMIPLSRSVFWGPMAISMMGGLLVATILTLVFLPALYAAWFRVKKSAEAAKEIPDPQEDHVPAVLKQRLVPLAAE